MNIKKIFWLSLLFILIVSGCQLFPPPNVETVVLENNLSYWHLSPNGDYLVYGAPRGGSNFLLNLVTGQEYDFDCSLHWWDAYRLGCFKPLELYLIDVKTLTKTPLIKIDLTKETDMNIPPIKVETLLAEADLIYRPEWVTDTVYILPLDYQLNIEKSYFIRGLTNLDELLSKYTVIVVPRDQPGDRFPEKTFSPNGLYYYDVTIDGFTIFNADNDKIISEFVEEDIGNLDILGWNPDSSGVYFITHGVGFLNTDLPKAIRKLKIPQD